MEAHEPYAAPQSDVTVGAKTTPIYSPLQVAAGAFVGGPVGLAYFLWDNFNTLGREAAARKAIIYGGLLVVALMVILPFLPESVPSAPFTVLYMAVGMQVAEKHQLSKQAIIDSPRYEFYSNWRVFGLGLLCMIGSAVALIGPAMVLAQMGVIS